MDEWDVASEIATMNELQMEFDSKVMGYYNISDQEWDALPNKIRNTFRDEYPGD
jgi:hypothetical protein